MITIGHELDNPVSQDFYDKVIESIQFHQLPCPCGHSSCLVRHRAYLRTVKVGNTQLRLRVCRVRCSHCGSTHAILLSWIGIFPLMRTTSRPSCPATANTGSSVSLHTGSACFPLPGWYTVVSGAFPASSCRLKPPRTFFLACPHNLT